MKKRMLSMLLAIVMVVGLLPTTALAASAAGETSGTTGAVNWSYDTDTKTLTISGTGAMVVNYYGQTVPWHDYKDTITSVVIEEGVTNVGGYAFYECSALTSVVIPASVTQLGNSAFSKCTSLTSIEYWGTTEPSHSAASADYLFDDCKSLNEIKVLETYENDTFYHKAVSKTLKSEQALTFTVTAAATPTVGGTVTGGGTYAENAEVTLTATANDGYKFVKWTENGANVSNDASYTFKVTGAHALTAVFEEIPAATHSHCYCGGGTFTDHTCGNDLEYTPITKFSEITVPGNYCIADGFTFGYYDRTISADGTVNLCLNGQSLSHGYATTITSGTTVNICDCSSGKTGTLGCGVTNDGTLNLYGGKIGGQIKNNQNAVLNIYGGSVEHSGNHAVSNNGTMTVYGGSITATGDYGYAVENNASLLIKDGTFEAIDDVCIDNESKDATIEGGAFIANGNNSVIRINGGQYKMEISGGTFTSKGTNEGAVLSVNSGNEVIVNGGTFTGGGTVISNSGTLTVTDGSFTTTTTVNNRYVLSATEAAVTNISGGTFTHEKKEVSLYVYRTTGAAAPVSLSGGTFKNGISVTSYRNNGYVDAYPKDLLADGYAYYQNDAVVVIDSSNQHKSSITGGDVMVKEEPKVEIYTITFDANGGSVSTPSAETNQKCQLASLPTPTREHYTFNGWFTDKEGGTKIAADTVFTSSQTVYAQWSPNTYKITYHLYDNVTEEGSYTYGEGATLKKDVIREGYRFGGWYKDTACTDGPYGTIGEKDNVNYTFYAKWVPEYAVTVQTTENGSVSADISKAIENETVTLTILPAAGYDLASVSVKDASEEDVALTGEGYTRTFKMPAGNVTVTATFEQAKVTFNANDGTGTMDAVTVSGATYTLPPCGFTAPATTVPGGMVFAGWAYSDDGDVITTETIPVSGNTELFAIWKYNPVLNQTIEKSGVFDKQHTFDIDLSALLPTDAKIKAGIDVSSSGIAVEKTTPQITVGSNSASLKIVTRITSGPANDTVVMKVDTENYGEFTFTVNVTLTGYTITYALDDGTVASSNPTTYSEETENFTLTNPTKTGYTFKGWSGTDLIGEENQTVTIAKGSTGNRAYTANWTANTYTVKFDANGGSGTMADQSFTYDVEQALTTNTFTYTNKYFNGWKDSEENSYIDGQNVSNLTALNGGEVVLYAQWSDKPAQTIIFDTTARTATYGDGALEVRAATAAGTITYSSSDETIATVDANGVVTVLKADEVTITASAAETAEYAAGSASYKLTIAPKALTITVADKSAYVGSQKPDLSAAEAGKDYTISGLVDGDNITVALSYVTEPEMNKSGEYEITASASDSNYVITVVKGKLTVSYAPVYSDPTYKPTIEDTTGGDVTVTPKNPEQGDKVTIITDPDKGYAVDEVTVIDRKGNPVKVIDNGDGTFTYVQPVGKVTITVTYVPEDAGFVDVEKTGYYYDAVNWAVANGITNGTSATTFGPNAVCTRAQVVTFLWRAAGSPEPKRMVCPFVDVDADSYCYKAVPWAVEQGITNGISTTEFAPNATVTRGQTVTFLWRSEHGFEMDGDHGFHDVHEDAYYHDAVIWAVENDITNGTSKTTFSPDNGCTRGQIVTFLYRCMAE